MSQSNVVLPINRELLSDMRDWLIEQNAFVPETLRRGRFPSQNELREAIRALGFKLEESGDWDVSNDIDFTQIWFKSSPGQGDQPVEFSCHRGSIIVLDIVQRLTNLCGSFYVINSSDGDPVLVVPDNTFPEVPILEGRQGYFATICHRATHLIWRLPDAPTDDVIFILTQFQHALHKAYEPHQRHELLVVIRPGLPEYTSLIGHSDDRVSLLARDLVETCEDNS